MSTDYASFATWAELLDAVSADYPLFYQAPLDRHPARVRAIKRRDGKLRVYPHWATDTDPFTADVAHLGRFRKVYRAA